MYRRQPPRRHACTRCVRLKVKCVPLDSTFCQRCTRLGHSSCVFPEHVRRSGNILRQHADAPETDATGASTPAQNEAIDTIFHDTISLHLTNELLEKYRTKKMPQFPFVIIPRETDVSTLRRRSPFLLLCILTASLEQNVALQDTLEGLVRKEVAQRVIVNVERNMDLLQGLLVHIAWHHYHWRTYHTHMYMLLQMTTMMIGDLGLGREESFQMREIPAEDKDTDQIRRKVSPSAAEQRAFLGCYYLCSKLSIFRQQLHMRHTRWMDQCVEALAEKAEFPTDTHLKSYIDVQSLAYQGQLLFDEGRRCPNHPPSELWRPVLSRIEQEQSQPKNLLSSLNTDDGWSLRIELEAVPTIALGQAVRRRRDVSQLQELNQLEFLTVSAHNVVDSFLSIPSPDAIHLPASAYATIWYCLLILSKLMLLSYHDSRQDVFVDRKRLHDQGIAIIQKFEEVSLGDDVWKSSKTVVGNMLAWLEKTIAERPGSAPINPQPGRDSHGVSPKSPIASLRQGARARASIDTQAIWPPTYASDELAPGGHQLQPADELWQQMLDSFTWFGPDIENDPSIGYYGNFV